MDKTFSDQLSMSLSDLLAARIGLHFPKERWRDLERGIAAAAPVFGMPDVEACARWLLSAPLTHNQIETLASHLTVGETYFFREKRSFEVLEERILPELLLRACTERRLRIWSAGCCTGEEPYSIAILLDRLIPHPREWNVTILATDINPAFLRKAAEGVYGDWSFRDTPAWVRERYFKRGKNARFEMQPSIRQRVTFSYLNLADDVYPSLTNNTNAMDVIFCRNVLMYFSAARAQKVIENLHRSLVDGGWLIVSPAETSTSLFSRFTAVRFPGAVLYRKQESGVREVETGYPSAAPGLLPDALPPYASALAADAALSTQQHEAPLNLDRPAVQPVEVPPFEVNASEASSRAARACANQGKLAEAAEWCEKAIAADKLNPAHQYLLATIRQELGQSDTATQSLMRTLYLDPDFVLAHFALGNLCLSQNRRREAERHFDNALTLLHTHPHDEPLPESEGLTAGRLTEIITSVRASLPRVTVGA